MASIHNLLRQVPNAVLRTRLEEEYLRAVQSKKFGLVFEDHIPECTPLYGVPIRRGSVVARKLEKINELFIVVKIKGEVALCQSKMTTETEEIPLNKLVAVAQFGEPIFPSLRPVDRVENAPDSPLWHTLIEADNYHALQLLEYLYPKKVDCIYIDPPYNNREKDWKYNNDYVDPNDIWRHSKWLSMMKKRLGIASRLLNPSTGVLIVTIDENEVAHLRLLLDELFPQAYIQMVTIVTNPKGSTQGRFSRVEEYAIFCFMPNAYVVPGNDSMLGEKKQTKKPRWKGLLRSGADSQREDSKNQFYPVLIDAEKKRIIKALDALPFSEKPQIGAKIDGYNVVWPIRKDLTEGRWMLSNTKFNELLEKGYISLGKYDPNRKTWGISYLSQGICNQIESGEVVIVGRDEKRNVVNVEFASEQSKQIMTVWHRSLHDAGAQGSDMVSGIIGQTRAFSFPKSLYSTKDAIAAVVRNNKSALILDFFAGSGTTLNAVNLLNAEDGGSRRCILVTNNEASAKEQNELKAAGFQPGDVEWEKCGICASVTWPRTKYSILGRNADGTPLEGEYFTNQTIEIEKNRSFYQLGFVDNDTTLSSLKKKQIVALIGKNKLAQSLVKTDSKFIVSEKHSASILFNVEASGEWLSALEDQDHITDFYIVTKDKHVFNDLKARISDLLGTVVTSEFAKRSMSAGFATNAEYLRLGFLDKNSVSLGRQFEAILPLLWLKSGAYGKRPEITEQNSGIMILPQNKFAVLLDETMYAEFLKQITGVDGIDTIYFVTNSEEAYHEMSNGVGVRKTYQLYRDYIDNFVIGTRRNIK